MRDYAKITSQFWTGSTGKIIRQLGAEAQVIALYLMTNRHRHMIGIYYLPLVYISHETGISLEKALKTMRELCAIKFCSYDEETEYVWVHEMAFYQIDRQLDVKDKRVKSINCAYLALPDLPFLKDFFDKYQTALCLEVPRENFIPLEAPSKLLLSTENKQEIISEAVDEAAKGLQAKETDLNFTQEHDLANCETETKPLVRDFHAPLETLQSHQQQQQQQQLQQQQQKQKEIFVAQIARPKSSSEFAVMTVFTHWKTVMCHPHANLDDKRKKLISKALQAGYSVDQLCEAITGCSLTPHNIGDNERGQRYDGLHVILRDGDQIDRFITNAHNPPKPLSEAERRTQANIHTLQNWLIDPVKENASHENA